MLNFCKESDFSWEIIVYGKVASKFQTAICLIERSELWMEED